MGSIKRWFLLLPFVQKAFVEERDLQIAKERSKWFELAQRDFQETYQDDINKQAEAVADKRLKELLFLSDMREILEVKGGKVFLNGKEVDSTQSANLKAEADFFQASELWKLLVDKLRDDAEQTMFTLGTNVERQLATGRTVLYTLSVQQNAIDRLQKLSTPQTPIA